MTATPSAADWATTRGEQWAAQLPGLEAMLAPVNEPLLDAAKLDAPCRIAEIGCGGGSTALEFLRRAPAGSVVHGFDINPKLIELAQKRISPEERALAFTLADMATAAPDKPYDRLISRFGIMFFDDPQSAFVNLARWLEPGGRFAFATWARPADNLWMSTVREVVARFVEVPQPDPEAPGPFRYADERKLLSLLDQAGLADLEVRDWRGAIEMGGGLGPAEAASFALAALSAFAELLAKAGDDARREAHRALTESFSRHLEDGVVHMNACVHLFTGARR